MSQETELLHCYHRGCGKKFDQNDNKDGKLHVLFGKPVTIITISKLTAHTRKNNALSQTIAFIIRDTRYFTTLTRDGPVATGSARTLLSS